jgi:uncharacterized protein (TIGR02266 family)
MLLKVSYEEPRDLLSDYLTDLGQGGMFVRTSAPFEIGETVHFAVSFPDLVEPIPLEGVVRWRREAGVGPETRPGVGVEFVFRDTEHQAEVHALLNKTDAQELPPSTRPFRVLLVEDNKFAQELFLHAVKKFHTQLKRADALEISTALSGQEALKLLKESEVDLAIVDYFLPVMHGGDVVREMRKNPRFQHTPILIISVGGEGVREDAIAAGADLYIDKPILLKQLLNTLRILLASRRSSGGEP